MRRLLALELRRAFARRLTRLLALGVLAGVLTAGIAVFFAHSDNPGMLVEHPPEDIQACLAGDIIPPGASYVRDNVSVTAPEPGTADREAFCSFAFQPFRAEDDRYDFASLTGTFLGTAVPLAMLALVLGASLIGAEWRANTVAVQLTWEPRRARVLIAKGIAAAFLGAFFFVAAQAVLAAALTPAGLLRGTTEGMDAAWWREAAGVLGRGAGYAAIASVVGFSIATVGRNTTAALGVMFGYFALAEGALLGSIWPSLRRWLVIGNSIVFVGGEADVGVVGRSPLAAGVLLGLYALGAFALATVWFGRRDVA